MNPRRAALDAILQVTEHGHSLSQVLPDTLNRIADRRDRGFAQHLIHGTLRWYNRLVAIRQQLVSKPLKNKDEDINTLILLALFQLLYLDTPAHAAVSETVALSQKLKKPWARGFLNGVLRTFVREQADILAKIPNTPAVQFSHPQWLVDKLQAAYPSQFETILQQNNQTPGLVLRVNTRVQTRDALLTKLESQGIKAKAHPLTAVGIELDEGVDITALPSFEQGGFSVQDAAAQQAALILQPQVNMRILDACAAPGGKTCHLLEACDNQTWLLALEKEPNRMPRLQQNLARLNLNAHTQVADAAELDSWWDGQLFDQILLDAPCSATGIIRRHPDIKHHRRETDISALTEIQAHLLDKLWTTLKPGGLMLYATCSILPDENANQIQAFLQRQIDAQIQPINVNWGQGEIGKQILPGDAGMDGFYYALLRKGELA